LWSIDFIAEEGQLHPRTIATLDRLEGSDWFSRVGVHDATTPIILASWPEAIEHLPNPLPKTREPGFFGTQP
jgi:hypothetical protein